MLAGKKTFSAAKAITTSTVVFLCIFVCSFLFILCLGFRHLDQRKTTQMPKSLFLSQAITSPTEHHLPIPSSVQWLHMKWVKITNIKMSLKNYSIQNVLDLINICFIVQSISRVATLTCAKIHSGGLIWKSLWRQCCFSDATFSCASPAVIRTCSQALYSKMVAIPPEIWIKHRKMCEICPTRVSWKVKFKCPSCP